VRITLRNNTLRGNAGAKTMNHNNLILIPHTNPTMKCNDSNRMFVPSFILSNVMSLSPKIDEVRVVIKKFKTGVDIAVFTETWLKHVIPDSVVHIPGYNIIRKDRVERTHGGVCVYVQTQIKVEILSNLISPFFEVLWLKLRPRKLPRGISSIILAGIYHISCWDIAMIDYLIDCLTRAEAMQSNCGIILMGDLNRLKTSSISRLFKLKKLVNFPNRGERTLDVILTNTSQFFDNPEKVAPFGLSDHFTISLFPKIRNINTNRPRVVKSRDIRPSNKKALGRVLSTIDWSCLDLINSCEGKVDFFNKIVSDSLNLIMPIKTRTIHNDAPWMSDKLKRSIKNRQRALQSGNSIELKYYRNVVNMERKKCKSSYMIARLKT
jgi:hypothetical protein